ncbi:MAG: sigma-70 family RNA polymerase sigma factor [Deltaproteobacteria bacterium]|nr:sigma-70 family RNA polymerase sigma factor [Deltaproteobacteria bacterium]
MSAAEHTGASHRLDDDAALVDRARSGDQGAFGQLVDRHHPALLRLARHFVRDPARAEDVAQDAWLAVICGLARFEGRAKFRTWLMQILANRARTRAARDHRLVLTNLHEGDSSGEVAVDHHRFDRRGMWSEPPLQWRDAELALGNQQLVAVALEAIQALPPNQRLVVTMRDVEGLDSSEVCSILAITETHQRVLLHRARARLRAQLEVHLGVTR